MHANMRMRVSRVNAAICCVHLYPAQGASSWFYLDVPVTRRAQLERICLSDTVDIAAYGTVLASGYGDEPPTHVVWAMQAQYGAA